MDMFFLGMFVGIAITVVVGIIWVLFNVRPWG